MALREPTTNQIVEIIDVEPETDSDGNLIGLYVVLVVAGVLILIVVIIKVRRKVMIFTTCTLYY